MSSKSNTSFGCLITFIVFCLLVVFAAATNTRVANDILNWIFQ